jgi:hypothetical protein
MTISGTLIGALALCAIATTTFADGILRADGHAPIGVMGDHRHGIGEFMLSYRFMHMDMDGNRIGDNDVSPVTIATTVPNRFFGQAMQPPTLRVVPTSMTMQMHMFGLMYAPTNRVTLMAMMNHTDKEMDHITFMGPVGTTRRGTFTTKSSGIGDTKLSGLFRLIKSGSHKAHLNLGFSIPTGSTTERDTILTPTGARPNPRLPYAMQLGSGTLDLLPGLTYTGGAGERSWGARYGGTVRLERDHGYQWGDRHELTGWVAYALRPWISVSSRLAFSTMDKIDGRDAAIVAPVQTADPDNYGGERLDLTFGLNLVAQSGIWHGQRIAIEGGIPVMQDLNGPQMETDFTLTVGWQYAF